jgi:hypothetical protein
MNQLDILDEKLQTLMDGYIQESASKRIIEYRVKPDELVIESVQVYSDIKGALRASLATKKISREIFDYCVEKLIEYIRNYCDFKTEEDMDLFQELVASDIIGDIAEETGTVSPEIILHINNTIKAVLNNLNPNCHVDTVLLNVLHEFHNKDLIQTLKNAVIQEHIQTNLASMLGIELSYIQAKFSELIS